VQHEVPQQVSPLLQATPLSVEVEHGMGLHDPLQYVPALQVMPHPPQLAGSLEGFAHLPLQQSRPMPQEASQPPLPLPLPVLLPLPL